MGLLDKDEIESFERDGFLILRDFFDGAEVDDLREATAQILHSAKRGMRGVGFDPWTKERGDPLNPNRVYYPCLMHRANSNYTETSKIGLINAYRSVDCIDIEQRAPSRRTTFRSHAIERWSRRRGRARPVPAGLRARHNPDDAGPAGDRTP